MAKGDQSAPIPGLAKFLVDARGEVKDLTKQIRDLEKGLKKAGRLTNAQASELDTLYRRRDALKRDLSQDRQIKQVTQDAKFLRGLATGQAVTSLLQKGFNTQTLLHIASNPMFIEALGNTLERAGKLQFMQGGRLARGLSGAGAFLGRHALKGMFAAELIGEQMDQADAWDAAAEGETKARRKLYQNAKAAGIPASEIDKLFRAPKEKTIGEAMADGDVLNPNPVEANFQKRSEATADEIERAERVIRIALKNREFAKGDFALSAELGLTGLSESDQDKAYAATMHNRRLQSRLESLRIDEALEAERLRRRRYTASPSELYAENMDHQFRMANFAARTSVLNRPSWLKEVNYD